MFLGKLFDFQKIHEENLLKKCIDNKDMVLSAPTGSGKTVLACKFIVDYLDENPNTVFLWLCPGAGGLQIQSQDSFKEVTSGIQYGDVYDFISDIDSRSKVFFINWDKINKSSNTVLREGEHKNLMERVADCHRNDIDIFMLIDEEHKYQDTANYFVNEMCPKHVLRISATPLTGNSYTEVVTDDEVISAGLITEFISINEGLSDELERNNNVDDDLLLIHLANEKRVEVAKKYQDLGINIRPLVLIQFPNGDQSWIDRVYDKLSEMGFTENSGLVTSWFSDDHPKDVDEIRKLNGQYSFLLFKQAIATGWDCPRAKILVKLREGGTESFNIQTIGRIRRMPERHHYNDSLLDRCYIYTLDNKFKEGLTNSISNSFYSVQFKLKDNCNLSLLKYSLDGSDKYAINHEAVVAVIRDRFLKEYDLDHNGILDKSELTRARGYDFSTVLKTNAFEGVARTTNDIKQLNVVFGGEHEISNHDDGFVIRDAKRKIASALGIDESISNNALRVLFGPYDGDTTLWSFEEIEFEKNNKLLKDMNLRQFNAFLVNNKDLLIDILKDISVNEIAVLEETELIKTKWKLPEFQYYKQHKKSPAGKILDKNCFAMYDDSILVEPNRSHGEIDFELWCEKSDFVSFVYKNGDKGNEFFSIVYKTAFHRSNFYPDYIVKFKNGDIWIIEVKGGMLQNGASSNIDSYAKNKFDSLKEYSEVNNVKFGFVRSFNSKLYISNTEWVEDLSDHNHWKPIENLLK